MGTRKRLVKDRERVLLVSSSVFESTAEDYPWLKRLIEDNPKATCDSLEPGEIKDFFDNRYDAILKQAISEWVPHSKDPVYTVDEEEGFRCELCNHRIQKICCIVNTITKEELSVGTECVGHFGMSFYGDLEKLLKEQKRLRRINILEKVIPGIESEIVRWNDEVRIAPVLIPNSIEIPYMNLGEKAKKVFEAFTEEGFKADEDKQNIEILKGFVAEKHTKKREIVEYIEANKDNKFVPKTSTLSWIKNQRLINPQNYETTMKWLKEDGKITSRTAFRIGEPSYLESLVEEFNYIFSTTTWHVEGLTQYKSSYGYVVNTRELNEPVFCKYSEFIYEFGEIIFDKDADILLDEKKLLQIGVLYDMSDLKYFLQGIEQLMPDYYGIYVHDDEMDEIIFELTKDPNINLYVRKKLADFIDRFKYALISSERDRTKASLKIYCQSLDKAKKLTKKEVDDILEARELRFKGL